MKTHPQNGFSLIELLVVLAVLSVVLVYGYNLLAMAAKNERLETQVNRLVDLGALIQEATYQIGVPTSMQQMIDNGYDNKCLPSTAIDSCSHINKTMWGGKITITPNATDKFTSVNVSLKGLSTKDKSTFIGLVTRKIPYSSANNDNVKISYSLLSNKTWTINAGGSGGGNTDNYIPADGSKKLTNDWVVGDKAITNVKDVIIKNGNDPQTVSIAKGIIRTSGTALSGENVDKPICSLTNTKPVILTWFNGIAPNNISTQEFTSISSVYARPIDNGKSWTLWTSFTALNVNTNTYDIYNSYDDRNNVLAQKAKVLMGYITMCRNK